jgi:chromate transport protein ChrA
MIDDLEPCDDALMRVAAFRIGFAILQAFPGPNFAFSSYLGVLAIPWNPVLGALLGYLGIFTPGILLKLSLLPVYKSWREYAIAKSALRGLNAAAVGLVYTAVWQLFLGEYGRVIMHLTSRH